MSFSNEIISDVSNIVSTKWDSRTGEVVPNTESIKLSGGAVELDATFLYADLANSSRIAKLLDRRVAAKILKCFLATSTKLIKSLGGTVISFDGDRVLGVFVGTSKNTAAAKCALQINWTVRRVIKPKFEKEYDTVRKLSFPIAHGVGIDTGEILIVRAGARGENDMISIGRAPSLAARLSELREQDYHTFITASVYNMLHNSSKFSNPNKNNMWESRSLTFLSESIGVYRSNWWWKP